MAQTILILISILLEIYILYLVHRITRVPAKPREPDEMAPRRFVTPFGSFAVESSKRKTTVNDDETLYQRELEG